MIVGFVMVMIAGCAGTSSRGTFSGPLQGRWLIEINSADVGDVRVVMDLVEEGGRFRGASREGAAGDILGWWDLMLAKMFTDYFEDGALLHLRDGRVAYGDSTHVESVLHSALGAMLFTGTVRDGVLSGRLTRKGVVRGELSGVKREPALPLDDYPGLVDSALRLTERHLYNHDLLGERSWSSFGDDIRGLAGRAQDDLELLFGFFHYGRDLPFSHYQIYRKPAVATNWEEADTSARIALTSLSPSVAYLRITSFAGTPDEITEAFERIIRDDPGYLIIDLRGNSGGNISAMKVASYLTSMPLYGGAFVTNRWFRHHGAPPSAEQFGRFPLLTEANVGLLVDGIHEQEGVCLKVLPEQKRYGGKVFVLVDGGTASSCEPLVYGIRQYGLGTVVGERTAGAMLNGEEFLLGGDWYITLPTAEYYAADGFRIDGAGVEPDVKVKSDRALDYVREKLIGGG